MAISMVVFTGGLGFFVTTQGASTPDKCIYENRSQLLDRALELLFEMSFPLGAFGVAWKSLEDVRSSTNQQFKQFQTDLEQNCTKIYPSLNNKANDWVQAMSACFEYVEYDRRILILKSIVWHLNYICANQDKILRSVLDGGVKCTSTKATELSQCAREKVENISSYSTEKLRACVSTHNMRKHFECDYKVLKTCANFAGAEMKRYVIDQLPEIPNCNETSNVV